MSEALLLMDIQANILGRVGAGDDYLQSVVETRERADRAGTLVVLVRVAFNVGYPEVSRRNKSFSAAVSAGGHLIGEADSDPHPLLRTGNGEVVVTKKRVSAFTGSDLEVILRSRDITRLVLAGISTSGVVLSTVREAADKDYELTLLEDLCLDPNPEVHRVLTEQVFPRQANVITSAHWNP